MKLSREQMNYLLEKNVSNERNSSGYNQSYVGSIDLGMGKQEMAKWSDVKEYIDDLEGKLIGLATMLADSK